MDIRLDIRDVEQEFALTKTEAQDMIAFVIRQLTATFARNWEIMAQKSLRSSRQEYIRSLYVGEEGRYVGVVILRGVFPNMIEQGALPFDMKIGLLASPKAKMGKKGKYITVPFRWATPGAIADNPVFSGVLPTDVYRIIKNQNSLLTGLESRKRTPRGLATAELPPEHQRLKTRGRITTGSKVFEAYKHKTALLSGVQRAEKTYEKATHGSYVTFRRVSEIGSDPDSWIHRGIVARKLAEEALGVTNVRHEVDRNTDFGSLEPLMLEISEHLKTSLDSKTMGSRYNKVWAMIYDFIQNRASAYNSDYAKCMDEIMETFFRNYPGVMRKAVEEIFRKHFA